jgi:hypothetical protein
MAWYCRKQKLGELGQKLINCLFYIRQTACLLGLGVQLPLILGGTWRLSASAEAHQCRDMLACIVALVKPFGNR